MLVDKTGFLDVLEQRFADLTPTGKRIAGYLLANPQKLPFETADSIAQRTETTGISVGRFLRSLGYRNLDDVKKSLRDDDGSAWVITDRLGAFREEKTHGDTLERSMKRELEAIQRVYALARGAVFSRIVERLCAADAVFIVGIQSTRGILNAFFSHLEYIRPKVYYVDGLSGTYAESLNSQFEQPYALIADFRMYSAVARTFCDVAHRQQLPLAFITDFQCPWARDYPHDVVQLDSDVGQFWDSLAPLACLLNLIVSAVAAHYGDRLDERLKKNRELQELFGQFD
jgi:DNA-binding MurR/RpiR family transcriptional regulator